MSAADAVLVVGAGNIFFGDDGLGCEVVRRLRLEDLPPGSRLLDVGIRARHLVYELLESPELVVIFDAVARGGPPGTLYVIEPQLDGSPEPGPSGASGSGGSIAPVGPVSLGAAHDLGIAGALATAHAMTGRRPCVRLIGCEPAYVGERMGLSTEVEAAVERALELLGRRGERTGAGGRRPLVDGGRATLRSRGQQGGNDATRRARA